MSRSPAAREALALGRAAWRPIGLLWHAACFGMGTGCLYIAPVQRPAVDHPPDIVSPTSSDEPIELLLESDPTTITLIASDPDEDVLWVNWSGVPDDIELEPDPTFPQDYQGEELWISVYRVPRDPRLDGRTLTAEVVEIGGEESVKVRWILRVEDSP